MASAEDWANGRIDTLVAKKPGMSIASVYLKRGVHNYLAKESARIHDWIDHASLFICDEQGKVDTTMLFNDLLVVFKSMEEVPFSCELFRGTIGKGAVRIELPDNPISALLFGDHAAIRITEEDFLELKEMLVSEE